jgi:hypothetical protein
MRTLRYKKNFIFHILYLAYDSNSQAQKRITKARNKKEAPLREDVECLAKFKDHKALFENQYAKYREQRQNLSVGEVSYKFVGFILMIRF